MNWLCSPARLALLPLGFGLLATTAAAQPDWRARPQVAVALEAGFTPDPHEVSVRAGGVDRNAISGNGCAGYINNAQPTVTLTYTAGRSRLAIYVRSDLDTTLLVNDASGNWHCSDDFEGSNPAIILDNPASGQYNIWVGTYTQDAAGERATVYISERVPRR
jgi:serine protease Do